MAPRQRKLERCLEFCITSHHIFTMFFSTSWFIVGGVVLLSYVVSKSIYLLYLHPLARFPGPKYAALTSWYEAYFDLIKKPGGTFMFEIERMHQIYGPIVRINPNEVHIKDSEWADVLYVGPAQGIRDKYPPSAHMTGTPLGIFGTVSHHVHRKRRAAISSMFSKRVVNNFEMEIIEKVNLLCKRMRDQLLNNGVAEMRTNFLALTTDTLCSYAFEESLDLLKNEQKAINWQKTIKAVALLTPLARQFTWIIPFALKLPLRPLQFVVPDIARIVALHRDLQKQAGKAIREMQSAQSAADKLIPSVLTVPHSSNIFKVILESQSLPENEKGRKRISQEAFVVMAAGGETTGRVLTTATYFLLANDDALTRLKKELVEVMADNQQLASLTVLEKLPWLVSLSLQIWNNFAADMELKFSQTAVIKESLRITALVTSRLPLVSPNLPLRYKEWEIPAGAPVSMTLRDILLDPGVFDEPLAFRPERWLLSNPQLERISQNYLPFGRGSRMCIGVNLALAELYITIATIFSRFELELHDTLRERDIDVMRDCFIGEVSPSSRGVWVKEIERVSLEQRYASIAFAVNHITIMLILLLTFIYAFTFLANASLFDESVKFQGLLGSHFGVPGLSASYDYVIIGGGTAGLAIANRLSLNTSTTVAVIEAGDFYEFSNGNLSQIPSHASDFTGNNPTAKNPYLDWYMYTEPQPQLKNQVFLYDSGKVIGGTSGRNFLWQIRGTVGCFDKWAADVGDDNYKFSTFLPYFQKTAKFHPPDNSKRPENCSAGFNSSDWSPSGGPAKVGYSAWVNPISSWLGLGLKELGLKELSSLLSGSLMGWAYIALELDPVTQTRSSSEDFLRDAFERSSNLLLYKSTLAKKINIKNGVANGVLVNSGGISYTINATKEVIISAGVMRSPQLLMVSGIGPRATLESKGIPVLSDLPGVGQNLWDNVLVGPTYQVDVVTHNSLADPGFAARMAHEYNQNRTGILTNVGGDIAGFEKLLPPLISNETYRSLEEFFPPDWPHIEYLVLDAYFGTGTDSTSGVPNGKQYVAASIGIVATFSRGNVTIASDDTSENPIISPNWLADPRDQEVAIAAFRRGRQLFETEAMRPIVGQEAFPGANITTDAQILDVIQASANSVYNGAGTNKMGKASDPMAVVGSTGKVFGIDKLRVVDASVFPFLPPGQPSATVCEASFINA
ncbi:hypothetical protein HYFRA_00004252 [Hymenoscyphus fraxineus]|uniref:Uncharacterized protein n=1 Tax=Hymenoscyphus fraxineus TaxID=746836 RepID=A0A9N9KPY0_9HELO|nr:hypothetical protein HYFRA_00004252 [Hymenoscyphus fraxineus]